MQITIIGVGKIKEKFMVKGIEEFKKRLNRYCKLVIIEVSDEKAPEHLSEKQREQVKEKEGARVLAQIKDNAYVIALDILGKSLTSEEFAKKMEELSLRGSSHLVFVIGGSLGLSAQVFNRANYRLSLSNMTYPHQLTRLILLEQIYRGFKINKGEPYHK